MSKIIGFLFPWRNTYRRLELHKRWWHRLATVLFFIALVPALLFTWVMADEANGPTNTSDSDISYWSSTGSGQPLLNTGSSSSDPFASIATPTPVTTSPPVDLSSLGAVPQSPPPPPPGFKPLTLVQKTIRMPDGQTATYPGTTPDASIEGDWKHADNLAMVKGAILGFVWAAMLTVVFSYLLQSAYRAIVYVIYGAKAGPTPDPPVAQ